MQNQKCGGVTGGGLVKYSNNDCAICIGFDLKHLSKQDESVPVVLPKKEVLSVFGVSRLGVRMWLGLVLTSDTAS